MFPLEAEVWAKSKIVTVVLNMCSDKMQSDIKLSLVNIADSPGDSANEGLRGDVAAALLWGKGPACDHELHVFHFNHYMKAGNMINTLQCHTL